MELPNGLFLPREWPPRNVSFEALLRRQPPIAPYLTKHGRRPILIDVGRQLFVDDWLVLRSNATFRHHQARVREVVLEPIARDSGAAGLEG